MHAIQFNKHHVCSRQLSEVQRELKMETYSGGRHVSCMAQRLKTQTIDDVVASETVG